MGAQLCRIQLESYKHECPKQVSIEEMVNKIHDKHLRRILHILHRKDEYRVCSQLIKNRNRATISIQCEFLRRYVTMDNKQQSK